MKKEKNKSQEEQTSKKGTEEGKKAEEMKGNVWRNNDNEKRKEDN